MSLWSAEQREWLQALGHDLLELTPVIGASMPPPVALTTAVATPPAARASAPTLDPADPLLRALLKAARRQSPSDLFALLPDPGALPREPAAKRALWPQLRALRKQVPAR